MALTVKILSQTQRPWGWDTFLEFYDGKTLVHTREVSGKPDAAKMAELAQKVQYDIEHPVTPEKIYTQVEVDKIVADAIKAVTDGK